MPLDALSRKQIQDSDSGQTRPLRRRSYLWEGLENLGYELEKRVFTFEGLMLAIRRCDLDNE